MKLSITTENKLGITDDVLSLIRQHQADLVQLEVGDGKIYLQTQSLDKPTQGTIASQLMQLKGVKWVNQIDVLPMVEQQNMLNSLLESMADPVLGINTKGQVAYANSKAKKLFQTPAEGKMPLKMKDIFSTEDWQEKVNAAGSTGLPVNIDTLAGRLLLEVQATKNAQGQMSGALLLFRDQEKVMASGFVMQGEDIDGIDAMVYQSDALSELMQRADSVAKVDASLHLIGESGTGKTLLAHICHSLSERKNRLFTVVDCQALQPEALRTTLFGDTVQLGVLGLNTKGTLFLSHVEFLPKHLQTELAAHIQQQPKDELPRIISSSAKRFNQMPGKVEPALAGLLDLLRLDVPALRDRKEDIVPLAKHFLSQFGEQTGKHAVLSVAAMSRMTHHYWPGNVSQLRNSLYKALMVNQSGEIDAVDLELQSGASIEAELEGLTLPQAVNEFEKHFLQHWYQKYPSSRKLAAQLGVSHTTIAQKINKYKLNQTSEN